MPRRERDTVLGVHLSHSPIWVKVLHFISARLHP